jgi:16S rRNA (uracil1498-N3)-methyltransferase
MQLFYQPDILNGVTELDPEESRHAIKVLRKTEGDLLRLVDGKGHFFTATITEANFRRCRFEVLETEKEKQRDGFRHIAIAPTKNLDRIEWFVEKSVEFGVDRISFVLCQNAERNVLKTDRLIKKAVSAMKQSLKARLPQIDEMVKLQSFLSHCDLPHRYIAYVDFDNPIHLRELVEPGQHSVVLIGPEGDFSEQELQQAISSGYRKVTLGESRLRTETAGLAAVHILNLFG